MMRPFLLWLSKRQSIFNFARTNRLANKFASRFVAGETIESAVAAAKELHDRGLPPRSTCSASHKPAEAEQARDTYLAMLRAMKAAGVEVNVSVKLTQMGLDIDPALCERNVRQILALAKELDGFVRLDMEGSPYTQKTLDFFEQRLFDEYRANVGVVLQSALRRTSADVADMIRIGARVRLCKGAYLEKADVAFPQKSLLDILYLALAMQLLADGNYPGPATIMHLVMNSLRRTTLQMIASNSRCSTAFAATSRMNWRGKGIGFAW